MKLMPKNKYIAFAVAVAIVIFAVLAARAYFSYESERSEQQSSAFSKSNFMESAKQEIDADFLKLQLQDRKEKAVGKRYHKIIKGNPDLKEIALTFDDGPHPKYTRELLEILKKYNVKATFFVVGKQAKKYPHLVKMQKRQGHLIGNHTYDHVNLLTVSTQEAFIQIKAAGKTIGALCGRPPHLFRPPGGNYNRAVIDIAETLGYTTVLWTANAGDCESISRGAMKWRIYSRLGNGGIILMHDGIQKTLDILPTTIENLRAKGYKFVTIDEMLEHRHIKKRQPGNIIDKIWEMLFIRGD